MVNSKGEANSIGFFQSVLALIQQVSQTIDVSRLLIVADAYFSKATKINPLIQLGISVVTRLRKDAVGFDDPIYCGRGRPPKRGKKWKLAQLLTQLENQWQSVTIYGKHQSVRYVSRVLWLREVTRQVKVVVIATKAGPIILLSTNLTLTAGQIIEIYAGRFSLEIAIRDLKQKIGFTDYQMTTTIAFLRFAQLCCCALSLGQLILAKSHLLDWVDSSHDGKNQLTGGSLTRLRRSLCRFVIKQILSQKSAPDTDFQKREDELEAIFRVAA
ncbi:transposase [Candidatus Poribacteria bacterium]|nr:transposase [Candidatus Poribacteria bacterium]